MRLVASALLIWALGADPMTTRGEWATQFLRALGNNNPTESTVNFVASWTLAENTRALYNPLATTQPMNGSSCFNSVCVRNYTDNGQGIEATVKTLTNGRYPHILSGLRNNEPETSANAGELGTWGTGLHGVALWRTGDHRDGKLRSHPDGTDTSSSSEPQSTPAATPAPNEQETDRSRGGRITMSDQDSADLARAAQYVILGALLIAVAVLLAIKTYVPTTQVVKTIAAVAK